ncbi:MAG: hypothetical protein JO362_13570 [Streptomycetaceae bacterium]|nr:hypothetical protein [Streptomycetaceae bacterium]
MSTITLRSAPIVSRTSRRYMASADSPVSSPTPPSRSRTAFRRRSNTLRSRSASGGSSALPGSARRRLSNSSAAREEEQQIAGGERPASLGRQRRETGHLVMCSFVMRSFEPGESRRWCYVDQRLT